MVKRVCKCYARILNFAFIHVNNRLVQIYYGRTNELGGNGDAAMFAEDTDAFPKAISVDFIGGLQNRIVMLY